MRAISRPPRSAPSAILVALAACLRRTPASVYALAILPAVAILVAMGAQTSVPVGHLTRDPLAVARETGSLSAVYGILSNLGVLALGASAGAAASGAAILLASGQGRRRYAAFMLLGAAIGGALALDDLFMIHESGQFAAIGGERTIIVGHALAMAAYLAFFRHEIIVETHGGLLVLSLGLFATSVAIDATGVDAPMESLYWLAEDGAKFLGIAAWTVFQIAATTDAARMAAGRSRV
jgi:hypothetical protein